MHLDTAILAVWRRRLLVIELDIVRNIEIQPPVAVIVCKSRTGAPMRVPYLGFLSHIRERPVVVIAIELVGTVVANIQIWPTVVVVVCHGSAHAPVVPGHTGLLGHVRESAVTV